MHDKKMPHFIVSKDRPGSLFQPGPGPGPGSAKSAGTGILPRPGSGLKIFLNSLNFPQISSNFLIY